VKVQLLIDGAPSKVTSSIAQAVAVGADGVFTFEGQHDVFLPLQTAAVGSDLELMTNVAIALPRSPLHLAHAAHDLQTYSQGRFRLGLGSQVRVHIEKRYGSRWDKPAKQMAEWIQATKAILDSWQSGAPLDFRGEYTQHRIMSPNFNPGPNEFGVPPVLLGALGPIMTRTAGQYADGLLVMPFCSRRHFAENTVPALKEGFDRAGRSGDNFSIIAQAMVAVGETDERIAAARNAVARLVSFYGSTPAYLPVLEIEGWADVHPELNALSKRGDFAAMRDLITDEMVDRIAVVGTPSQVAAEIGARFGAHSDEVCCYFPGYDPGPALTRQLVDCLHEVPDVGHHG